MTALRTTATMSLVVLVLSLAACSRQPLIDASEQATAEGQALPFDRVTITRGVSPTEAIAPRSIPAGTPITVRLQSAVSSAHSQPGDVFDAALDEPIIVDGQTVVPRGAGIAGKVVAAKASGRLKDPGYIRLALTSISIDGKLRPVQTGSVFAKGESHENRNLAFIGGGTGAGALLGGIAGGGKGVAIGSAIGAAGGTGAAYATGKKDVEFSPEKRLTFRLTQQLDLKP